MGILSSLFGGKKKAVEAAQVESQSLESMSLSQILEYLRSFKGSMPSSVVIDAHKRLFEIALYDHHVDQQVRVQAMQVLDALNKDIQAVHANNPDFLRLMDEAAQFMESKARFTGVGSLYWLMQEYDIRDEQVVSFVMKPEYGHLVADLLTAMGPEAFAKVKDALVKNLILARQYGRCTNAVLTLHGLAAKGDQATVALFDKNELAALVAVPDDYAAGRRLLANLGLLPAESSALPFVPVKDKARLIQLMVEVYKERDIAANADPRMTSASKDKREILQAALAIQRLHLIRRMVGQVHGGDMAEALLEVLSEGLARDNAKRFDEILARLEAAPSGTPIDFMLLDQFMSMGGISTATQEDFERERPWLEMGSNWLNSERVEVLDYTRYLLRWVPDNIPPKATIPYLEDWIGLGVSSGAD